MSTTQNRITAFFFVAVFFIACGGPQQKRDVLSTKTDLVLRKIDIRGVDTFSISEIKTGLVTKEDPGWRAGKAIRWVPVLGAQREYFDPVVWKRDLERIRVFYASHGFFNARIVNEVINRDEKKKRVRLSIKISEGEPTEIGSIDIDGITDVAQKEALRQKLKIGLGDRFEQRSYLQAKEQLAAALRDESFAFASVRGRVYVDKEKRKADIFFVVDPGPASRFGEVKIEGLKHVAENRVGNAVTIKPGAKYSPAEIDKTQETIYDLGVFSLVKVNPLLDIPELEVVEKPEDEAETGGGLLGDLLDEAQTEAQQRVEIDPVVPVTINVSEAKLWNVRVGAGAAIDKSRQDLHAQFNWASRNFLGGLRRLEQFNTLGYAWAPTIFSQAEIQNQGVILDSELRFTQPQFIERFTSFEARIGFERDVEPGFTLLSPSSKVGVRRKFFRHLTVDVAYNFALFFLSDINASLLDRTLRLNSSYVLEYMQQTLLLDYRDSVLNPTKGFSISLDLQEATKYLGNLAPKLGSEFDYIKPTLDAELYLPYRLLVPQVLAIRGRLSTIYVYGRDKPPPLPQKVYAGGTDSMRSFGRQKLSLYSFEGEPVPIGGLTRIEGVVEPRVRVVDSWLGVGDLWVAPFFDAATVLGGPFLIDSFPSSRFNQGPVDLGRVRDSFLYGVGLGAWWVTPIGPVRLDLAYRLSDIRDDERFRRCAVEPIDDGTCPGAAFVPVAEDPVQGTISRFNFIVGIGHSF